MNAEDISVGFLNFLLKWALTETTGLLSSLHLASIIAVVNELLFANHFVCNAQVCDIPGVGHLFLPTYCDHLKEKPLALEYRD